MLQSLQHVPLRLLPVCCLCLCIQGPCSAAAGAGSAASRSLQRRRAPGKHQEPKQSHPTPTSLSLKQEHARVDFESERNAAGQAAAYLPVEVLLAKLEALTGTAAAAQSLEQYREMYR